MRLPLLVLHITAGTLGILFGFLAIFFLKGSRRHLLAGNVFVISMVLLSSSGAYPGFMKHQILNGQMGVLTFYLVATAWVTARRGDGETGIFDWGALMVPLAVGAGLVTYGLEAANSQTGLKARHCQAAAMFTCYRPSLSVARRSKSWCSVCADSRFSTPRLRRLPQHMA